jgi:hypothetical protein
MSKKFCAPSAAGLRFPFIHRCDLFYYHIMQKGKWVEKCIAAVGKRGLVLDEGFGNGCERTELE